MLQFPSSFESFFWHLLVACCWWGLASRLLLLSAKRRLLLVVFCLGTACAFCLQLIAVKNWPEHLFDWCLRGICVPVRLPQTQELLVQQCMWTVGHQRGQTGDWQAVLRDPEETKAQATGNKKWGSARNCTQRNARWKVSRWGRLETRFFRQQQPS